MRVDDLLQRLGGVRSRGSGQWSARCPAHNDHSPSLSITERDGKTLLFCHAGCSIEEIATALGVPMKDLFTDNGPEETPGRIAKVYNYVDEAGGILYQTIRYEPKGFKQRRPKGNGIWIWDLKGTRRVLYHLPNLAEEMKAPIIFHEGEKAVEAALAAGLPGCHTTTVGGSKAPRQTDFSPVKGRNVIICPDNDDPGEAYLRNVASMAQVAGAASVKSVRLPGLPPRGDVVEWLEAGGTAGQFAELVAQAETCLLAQPPDVTAVADTGREEDCGLTKSLADQIQRDSFFAKDAGKLLYVFDGGTYKPRGKEVIELRVKQITVMSGRAKKWSTRLASEVYEYIRVDAPTLWERPSLETINVLNGLLDWRTGTLRPHDPHHLSSVQIPVTYDPSATCPNWDRFVQQVFPADCCMLAYEIIGWLMIPDMSLQKAILMIGEGANGKSVYLSGVSAFLGHEHIASLSLQRLESDKFSQARLVGKLANICADLPSEHLAGTSVFKAIVGGDRLLGERKFQGSFEFVPFCRLVFSTNSYPQSRDSSAAFFRRWIVIPFERTFAPGEQISRAELDAQLADPSELSGLLNQALKALRALRTRGGFTQSETTSAAALEFVSLTDPVGAWLDHHTDADPGGMVSKKDLTIVYNADALATARPAMSAKAFCSALRRHRPTVEEAKRTHCGIFQAVFIGLRLKDTPPQDPLLDTTAIPHSLHSPLSPEIIPAENGTGKKGDPGERLKLGNSGYEGDEGYTEHEGLFAEEVVCDDH